MNHRRVSRRAGIAAAIVILVAMPGTRAAAGDLDFRFALTLDRALHGGPPVFTDQFVLADAVPEPVRRFTDFSGDFSGRYLGALAMASRLTGRRADALDRVVGQLVKLQKADGHFGEAFGADKLTERDMATLWGNGRLLIGLLEYYRVEPSPAVLASARQLGDWLIQLGPRLNSPAMREDFGDRASYANTYICWTQITEGMVALYRVIQDQRYLQLAEAVAANTRRFPRQHCHGFLTSLRGILELYRVTHDPAWLRQVEADVAGIAASGDVTAYGAVPEILSPDGRPRDEGCAEADWVRLNLALWTSTGKRDYLEAAELTWFNEFSFNQFSTGDFGHRTATDAGIAPGCSRAWWCCTLHGLRAFPDVAEHAFHAEVSTLCYDLPVDGKGQVEGLTLRADASLGQDASVKLTTEETDRREHALRVQRPAWASTVACELDGRPLASIPGDQSIEVRRVWKRGETVTIRYAMRVRVLPNAKDPKRIALMFGPWFLGVDEVTSPKFYDELWEDNSLVLPPPGADGEVHLAVEKNAALPPTRFNLPVAHFKLEYLAAAYPIQPQTAFLHPIAEQTSLLDWTPWVFWFQVKR